MNEPRQSPEAFHTPDGSVAEDPRLTAKYEFLDTIGSGGMGVIYKARQIAINKIVAIKMLRSNVSSEAAFGRFQREAKATSLLSNKYIVTMHDLGATSTGHPYLVMDYIDGQTLAQEIRRHGPLPLDRFLRIMLQITNALQHAHEHGVLHRDLKPSNIMLVPDDKGQEEVRILDFGIAKVLSTEYSGQQLTKTGETIGSPLYMSPEQCRSGDVDQRSDLYSLGCVMYETVTGTPPFVGNTAVETIMRQLDETPLPMVQASLGRDVDAGLQDIVSRLLAKNPSDRYQTAAALENDLRQLQDATIGGRTARFIYTPSHVSSAKKNRVPVWWLALAGTAALTLGILVWHIASGSSTTPIHPPVDSNLSQIIDLGGTESKQLITSAVAAGNRRIDLRKMQQNLGAILSITDDDLSPLKDATEAEEIDFPPGVHITDAGLAYVKDLKLKTLDIEKTEARTLSALKTMTSLLSLDASQSWVDSRGFAVIAGLHNLESLNICNTTVSDSDLSRFKSLRNLKTLHIMNCSRLSNTAVQDLRESLPHCLIVSNSNMQDLPEMRKGLALMEQKKYRQSDLQYQLALDKLAKQSVPDKLATAFCYGQRSICLYRLGKFRESADQIEKQIPLLTACPGTGIWLAGTVESLARNYELCAQSSDRQIDQRLIDKAINAREKAATLLDTTGGTQANVTENLRFLANDYHLKGDQGRAIQILENLIARCKQMKIERSMQAAGAMHSLADLYVENSQFQTALPLYVRASALYDSLRLSSELHQQLWYNQARCYLALKQPQKAQEILELALANPCKNQIMRRGQYEFILQVLAVQNVPPGDPRVRQYNAALKRIQEQSDHKNDGPPGSAQLKAL